MALAEEPGLFLAKVMIRLKALSVPPTDSMRPTAKNGLTSGNATP